MFTDHSLIDLDLNFPALLIKKIKENKNKFRKNSFWEVKNTLSVRAISLVLEKIEKCDAVLVL